MSCCLIPPKDFHACVQPMREFCIQRGFVEAHPQSALSILSACEDPQTVSSFEYGGKKWPLPQTGQMWLEHVLLENPDLPGCFCVSTSYRDEPNPVAGRHEKIFPMFEFELKGGMDELIKFEKELLQHLGFTMRGNTDDGKQCYPEGNYLDVAEMYGVNELEHDHETRLNEDYGEVFLLKNFPFYTSPFWNMKADFENQSSNKIDVIMHGQETIGSAERSCNRDEMKKMYKTISNGEYAQLLYDKFTEERVDAELDKFLEFDFFQRCGGGIGVTRMIRAMKLSNLI
jgi:aspartyl/asparaginyl-tRNA synthetase